MKHVLFALTLMLVPAVTVADQPVGVKDATELAATPEPESGDEVEVVSMNGSITRAKCPHTCEMRGIPRKFCKEWTSQMYGDRCYVQDTRLPSDAIPLGGPRNDATAPR